MEKLLSMNKEIITFDMIGAAYVAEADARRAYEAASRRYADHNRGTVANLQRLQDAAEAARRERARLVLTFAGAVHCNSVTVYSDRAA
jgi:hypothetical protein